MAKRGTHLPVSKGKLERLPRPASAFPDIDRLFDDFFSRRWMRPFSWESPFAERDELGPSVDIIDRDDEILVRAAMPGFKKEDIEVSVSGDLLTLSGEAEAEDTEEKGDYYRSEISRGAFSRTLQLPAAVDESKAKASMRDGMLELRLPKLKKAKRRTIEIS
jgi:HSP20 family protein